MANNYPVAVQGIEPASGGFGQEGGTRTVPILVNDGYLNNLIIDLLGDVRPGGVGNRLIRRLPRAHPRWTHLFCSHISDIKGRGYTGAVNAAISPEALALEQNGSWQKHLVTAVFTPRPYAVMSNSAVPTGSITWYKEDNTNEVKEIAGEWLRYTDYSVEPASEIISAQHGAMCFRTASTSSPHRVTTSGFPKTYIPTATILFTWFQVPFCYVDSITGYIRKYIHHINQYDWYRWPKGSLLYNGAKVKRYTPPLPDLALGPAGLSYSMEKVCDITFEFLYTDRTGTDVPASVSNPNWITAGWNLHPWHVTRKFYYLTNSDPATPASPDSTRQSPTFPSVPFELLFQPPTDTSGLSSGEGYGLGTSGGYSLHT